ncbi:MAG: Ig-like domain-containing protein, partial [Nitrospirota bacterium]
LNCNATTYYVAPGGSNTWPGTVDLPFSTIQKAVDIVNSGDIVIVKDGIYTAAGSRYPDRVVQFNRGGTAAAWVTVKAENQYGAILDGQNYSTTFGVVFFNSYINFDGFQIRNFKNAGLWMQGSASGVQTHDIAITRNWVHHIARVMIADCADGDGRVGAYTTGYVYNVKWDSNLWHDIGRIPNLACDSNLSSTPNYRHDHGLYLQGKYHTVINNIFYNMYAGWPIKVDGFYGALSNAADASHTIVNNTFAHPAVPREITGHIRFFANQPAETDSGNTMLRPVNVHVENNISYNPPYWSGASAASWGPTFIAALYDGVMYYSGTVVRNNITTAASIIDEVSGGSEITSKVTFSGNRVQTNPALTDPVNNNFLLTAASAARLGAYAADAPPYDFVGVARPLDYPDVGAYQYVHGDSFALAVTSPTNGTLVSGTIPIQVADAVGMTWIAITADGSVVYQSSAESFEFTLDSHMLSDEAHTLAAIGLDASGNVYSSAAVIIEVVNSFTE